MSVARGTLTGVVSWSIGKTGGRSHDGLCSHRVKDVLTTYI